MLSSRGKVLPPRTPAAWWHSPHSRRCTLLGALSHQQKELGEEVNRLHSIMENKQDMNTGTSGTLQRFLEDVGVNFFTQILQVSSFRSATQEEGRICWGYDNQWQPWL